MIFGISRIIVTIVSLHITIFRLLDMIEEKPSIILDRIPV